MRIESNIGKVISDFRLAARGLDRARVLTVAPAHWFARAKSVAAVALGVHVAKAGTPQLQRHIEGLVNAITIEVFHGSEPGFTLSLRNRPATVAPLDLVSLASASVPRAMVASREDATSLPLWRAAFFADANQGVNSPAYLAILNWVESGQKELDDAPGGRDAGKSNPEIAERIYNILFGRRRSDAKDAARDSLLKTDGGDPNPPDESHPHLLDSIRRVAEAQSLDRDTAGEWLEVVLAAWRKMICSEWRAKFWTEYRAKPAATFSLKS